MLPVSYQCSFYGIVLIENRAELDCNEEENVCQDIFWPNKTDEAFFH